MKTCEEAEANLLQYKKELVEEAESFINLAEQVFSEFDVEFVDLKECLDFAKQPLGDSEISGCEGCEEVFGFKCGSCEDSHEIDNDDRLKYLAAHDPMELLRLIQSSDLRGSRLTFAAEYAGSIKSVDAKLVISALESVLKHERAYVREGAVYGLTSLGGEDAIQVLKHVAENDPSDEVRDIARAAIAELYE